MSGAESAIGPELSGRVELVRAALPGADRARFEQELDQALDMVRSTRDLVPLGHVVEGWWRVAPVSSVRPRSMARRSASARRLVGKTPAERCRVPSR